MGASNDAANIPPALLLGGIPNLINLGVWDSFHSGAYRIKGFGVNGKVIYEHNPNGNGYVSYATAGMQMRPYIIKPFKEWKFSHSFDDIRVPNYPIDSL